MACITGSAHARIVYSSVPGQLGLESAVIAKDAQDEAMLNYNTSSVGRLKVQHFVAQGCIPLRVKRQFNAD